LNGEISSRLPLSTRLRQLTGLMGILPVLVSPTWTMRPKKDIPKSLRSFWSRYGSRLNRMASQSDVALLKWFEEHISHPESDTKSLKPQPFPEGHTDASVSSKRSTIEVQAQVRTEVY